MYRIRSLWTKHWYHYYGEKIDNIEMVSVIILYNSILYRMPEKYKYFSLKKLACKGNAKFWLVLRQEPAFQELILLYTDEADQSKEREKSDMMPLQLKIFERIPIPDLPVSVLSILHLLKKYSVSHFVCAIQITIIYYFFRLALSSYHLQALIIYDVY